MPERFEIDLTIDTSGKFCPIPMVETAKAVTRVAVGGVIEILATDPASRFDIPVGIHRLGHELISVEQQEGVFRYLVRRKR